MNAEVRKNLVDVLQAAEEIAVFTGAMDFNRYQASQVTQRAVERDFEIIGEALNRIKRIDGEFCRASRSINALSVSETS